MRYQHITLSDVQLFYREMGERKNPAIVLLHGFPTSSHMYRELMPLLAEHYYVVAPDLPGFGFTQSPPLGQFEYSFDHLARVTEAWLSALGLNDYFLYIMDYGAPVGLRIASRHPERVRGLIIQNGNAYAEGLTPAWEPIREYWKDKSAENAQRLAGLMSSEFTREQYVAGTRDPARISPESWGLDCWFFTDPQRREIQLELFYDYQSNLALYDDWQAYFRAHQPPALITWGVNDMFFSMEGAQAYQRDLKNIEQHYFDTGHFALEDHCEEIGYLINRFAARHTG